MFDQALIDIVGVTNVITRCRLTSDNIAVKHTVELTGIEPVTS